MSHLDVLTKCLEAIANGVHSEDADAAATLAMHERMHEIFGALHAQNTVNNSQN